MKYDCVVVGSGLAGVTSARLLAEQGYSVLIVEARKNIAGQCYDYKNKDGITIHKYGPHIFHTQKQYVWNFVNRFSDFSTYQHRVLSYSNGNYFKFPINRDTINDVFGLNLSNDEILPFLSSQAQNSTFDVSLMSYKDVVISQVGEKLYEMFFESYTRKQWDCNPSDLSPDLAGRIPVRLNTDDRYFCDPYQGIPLNGYTEMIQRILDHDNIQVLSGCDYFSIKDQVKHTKLLVYTGLLDRFFDYKYGKLQYRSVRIELKTFEINSYQPASVVNYPNDYDWTRITEFKKMTGDMIENKTTVCYEYPQSEGEPFYIVPTSDNLNKRSKYMQEVSLLEDTHECLFIGRLAEYKYYNMDQAIDVAMKKIKIWLEEQ
jgi:UDP-galactopyranose mutase